MQPSQPPPKKLLDRVRDVIRLKHYSFRTEETYNQLPRRKRTGYANRFAPKPAVWIAICFLRCKQRGMYPY